MHTKKGYTSCYKGKSWDETICPDGKTCATDCVIDGIKEEQWETTYGVEVSKNKVTLVFFDIDPFNPLDRRLKREITLVHDCFYWMNLKKNIKASTCSTKSLYLLLMHQKLGVD